MTVEAVARALNIVDERLSPAQKLVLVGMANHDGDGGCWPGIPTLARYAGMSDRSVQRAIGALVELGYVTVLPQAGGSPGMRPDRRPNRYVIHYDGVPDCHPAPERGDTGGTNGVTAVSPEPSKNHPYIHPQENSTAREDEPVDSLSLDEARRRLREGWSEARIERKRLQEADVRGRDP